MNQFRLLKPEDAARRAKANVEAFKKEQERKAAAAKLAQKRHAAPKPAPLVEDRKENYVSEKQQKLNTDFLAHAAEGHADQVERLLREGADVDAVGAEGNTALMNAAKYGYVEIAKMLIDAKANVNAKDSIEYTALMKAATEGH